MSQIEKYLESLKTRGVPLSRLPNQRGPVSFDEREREDLKLYVLAVGRAKALSAIGCADKTLTSALNGVPIQMVTVRKIHALLDSPQIQEQMQSARMLQDAGQEPLTADERAKIKQIGVDQVAVAITCSRQTIYSAQIGAKVSNRIIGAVRIYLQQAPAEAFRADQPLSTEECAKIRLFGADRLAVVIGCSRQTVYSAQQGVRVSPRMVISIRTALQRAQIEAMRVDTLNREEQQRAQQHIWNLGIEAAAFIIRCEPQEVQAALTGAQVHATTTNAIRAFR